MDIYVAELDEAGKIAAVWVKKDGARGPGLYDARKHTFNPKSQQQFAGASRREIESWIAAKSQQSARPK